MPCFSKEFGAWNSERIEGTLLPTLNSKLRAELIPLEHFLFPSVDQPEREDDDKKGHFNKGEEAQLFESDRPGIDKNRFNIKNHKERIAV